MADKRQRPHLIITNTASTERFTSPASGGGRKSIPERDRHEHGQYLLQQVRQLTQDVPTISQEPRTLGVDVGNGFFLQFESEPNFKLPFESLENTRQRIELINVQEEDDKTLATVFVPEGKLSHFEKIFTDYLEKQTISGKPKNETLVNSISRIRMAAIDALWTDDRSVYPQDDQESIWWEIWLRIGEDRETILNFFREYGQRIGLEISNREIRFPERTVVSARGTKAQLTRSIQLLNCIAELRRVKETADFFDCLDSIEQREWINEALERIDLPNSDAFAVCIFDTGVNESHPLLSPMLAPQDIHTVNPNWGKDDRNGHGTNMAGLALYGDLTDLLDSSYRFKISHRLESVKILRKPGHNDDGALYGDLTREAISRVEIQAPQRKRVVCMAVSTKDNRDRGKPSTWSAALDSLSSGLEDETRRLIIVSAGNVELSNCSQYPNGNTTDGIHDPGQSWNALTVGAFTDKDWIDPSTHPDYRVVASKGDLSPFSCTSAAWGKSWPLKPDVVFEGGNAAYDPAGGVDTLPSLQLLTTKHHVFERPLVLFNGTSAATALAARMAAQIQVAYPDFWPETTRALIVHSAEWTQAMLNRYAPSRSKTEIRNLIRHCGFGIPSLEAALWSAGNSLTLIAQDSLQPFDKTDQSIKSRDMNLHKIPWPTEVLQELSATAVEMRVTLSYFIEPNPASRGWTRRYRYESHGLRFDVKRPTETVDEFRYRINRYARDEEKGTRSDSDDSGWTVGSNTRHLGSIHSDSWIGTAADLAQRGYIAVYPALGWWKERPKLERWNKRARYVLVISIKTQKTEVDLYSVVEAKIPTPTMTEIPNA
jgi:Subtilase family